MENNKNLNLGVIVFNGIFTVICIALLLCLLLDGNLSLVYNIEIIADIIASIVAFMYLVEGFSKSVATHYKTCMIIAAINALIVVATSASEKIDYVPMIMCAIAFCLVSFLAFGTNLGRNVSFICCGLLVLIRVAGLVSVLITLDQYSILDPTLVLVVCQISLALLLSVITYAKYKDKAARGAK